MPDRRAVDLYEVGIRLTQCQRAFPGTMEDDSGLEFLYQRSLLHRLGNSLDALFSHSDNRTTVQRRCEQIMDEILSLSLSTPTVSAGAFHALLSALKQPLARWLEENQPRDRDFQWFQLGLAIADGTGDAPAVELFYSDSGVLTSGQTAEARWYSRDESRLNHLVEQLNAWEDFPGLERLLPEYNSLPDPEDVLPGTPEHLWGWIAIETGLRELRIAVPGTATSRRRRGRRRDPAVQERDRWIRRFSSEHPDLRGVGLYQRLVQENEDHNYGYKLGEDIVRNAIRRR